MQINVSFKGIGKLAVRAADRIGYFFVPAANHLFMEVKQGGVYKERKVVEKGPWKGDHHVIVFGKALVPAGARHGRGEDAEGGVCCKPEWLNPWAKSKVLEWVAEMPTAAADKITGPFLIAGMILLVGLVARVCGGDVDLPFVGGDVEVTPVPERVGEVIYETEGGNDG